VFGLGGGVIVNIGPNSNLFLKTLARISPLRYGAELLLRTILKDVKAKHYILEQLNYEYGETQCVTIMIGFILLYFLMSWVVLVCRARH
jgi:hypothetical protein